jgi:hypothetical protein
MPLSCVVIETSERVEVVIDLADDTFYSINRIGDAREQHEQHSTFTSNLVAISFLLTKRSVLLYPIIRTSQQDLHLGLATKAYIARCLRDTLESYEARPTIAIISIKKSVFLMLVLQKDCRLCTNML